MCQNGRNGGLGMEGGYRGRRRREGGGEGREVYYG